VSSRNNPGDVSRQFQTEEVRRLAGDEVERLQVVDKDWGRSAATDKTDRRLGFLELLASVEAGKVSTLYAYASDRLARSVEWSARLLNACRRAKVPIVTSEGRFDPDNALTDQLFYFQAMQNEAALRGMEKKAQSTTGRRRARGDKLGQAGYGKKLVKQRDDAGRTIAVIEADNEEEPITTIVEAFERAGSAYGAARVLNSAGVATRRGALWSSKVVGDVLHRAGVITPPRGPQGVKAMGEWYFARLLICPCGQVMTGMDRRTPRYTCYVARHKPGHSEPFGISERKLLPALISEAAHLQIPAALLQVDPDDGGARRHLQNKRMRWLEQYADGLVDREERDRRIAAIDDEIGHLDALRRLVAIPQAVDWSQPPRDVNRVLRTLWERVELGPDLMPVRFVWTVPEWRTE
jgi:DNA invertase Pin-like site-specific DNA recombinase